MKKILDLKKAFSNLELEGQGRGIIMGVTRLLLLGLFYTIQSKFMYYFAHDCIIDKISQRGIEIRIHLQNLFHPIMQPFFIIYHTQLIPF